MNTHLKGAEIAIKTLEQLGVECCFAYPGGSAVDLHQALADSSIRVILPRHEQGGAFAACGYARASGKTGVCMATSGPGATNLLTGIADAYMDSIPLVIITGQVEYKYIGKNAFQEIDIIGMTRPIVKHSYLVLNENEIGPTIMEAFELAQSGRPGPVWIDIPKNFQQAKAQYPFPIPARRQKPLREAPSRGELDKIKAMIAASERPCIYAGGGIIAAEAGPELTCFAESYGIPVATSLMGIGAIPENHPLSLRFLGMHGNCAANYAADRCDLLLAFGARFADRSTGDAKRFAAGARIIHVDIDESEINKNVRADLGIVADIRRTLAALNAEAISIPRPEWLRQIRRWQEDFCFRYPADPDRLRAQRVIGELSRQAGGEAIIVPGVGQHQMWTAQFYQFTRPRQLLTSGGLGSMGFGLPAAIGAKLARPEKTVINIDGDGSFQMNMQELGTIAAEGIDVKMVILNNGHLGMVAQIEDLFYRGKRGNTDLRNPNGPTPEFAGIAAAYGIPAMTVEHPGELEDAVRRMLATPGSFLLDCRTVYEDHVLPMIPGGKSCQEMIK